MEHGKILDQQVQDSLISLKRRANMLGQALTNRGFEGVDVEVTLTVKVKEPNGSGTCTTSHASKYQAYKEGFGPAEIGGTAGALQTDDNGAIVKNDPYAPNAQTAAASANPIVAQPSMAASAPLAPASGGRGSGRKSVWGNPG